MLEKTRDNEIHVEKVEEPPAKSIAFGLERLGLIPMKAPVLSCIVLAILMVGAVFGIDRIKIDDSLSQLFRSNTKEFHQYE
jgi:predicted RND superfamily exporter protein